MKLLSFGLLYWRTLRHLKRAQWFALFALKLKRSHKAKAYAPKLTPLAGKWLSGPNTPGEFTAPNSFRFLNTSSDVEFANGWKVANATALWEYNLHYFHYINSLEVPAAQCLRLIESWVNDCKSGTAWAPYPTSLRIVNWIRFHNERSELPEHLLRNLTQQVEHLSQNTERHLLANHYFANGKALFIAGLFFQNERSEKWFHDGLSIIESELDEQFLEDGGHFERSPMYQRILTLDLFELVNASNGYPGRIPQRTVERIQEVAKRALRWMSGLRHPDGAYPLFGDSAYGIPPSDQEIFRFAGELAIELPAQKSETRLLHFEASGFARAEAGNFCLLADIGEIRASYQPGHAHADSLGFELSVGQKRILVDTGVDRYESGRERTSQRSTAAHNCLSINHQNSQEVWSSFRVARRARTSRIIAQTEGEEIIIHAQHDGYEKQNLAGPHSREWRLSPQALEITDTVTLNHPSSVSIFFIIHSDFIAKTRRDVIELFHKDSLSTKAASINFDPKMSALAEPCSICHQFGISQEGTRIELQCKTVGSFKHTTSIAIEQ
ncbi:alginate lyase family protein [Pelagicoccus sp. NFK12]|uniref:Alginate lyase family protein n=1 Tax=Pelagicoccus enzymogenes TaxID=2773457 RepID=A0A927FAS6_9BACT|nr:heparinase II/III family protein [Pelagicoccus enzymogenes]MBD5781449.1 alginate lyase family protein [Pelagicoccus enzymogenes]